MASFGWQFDRGQYDPESGTTPVRVTIQTGDPSSQTQIVAIITEEAARDMRDALSEVCGSGLAVASVLPMNGEATG
jgi:hypothetical protein